MTPTRTPGPLSALPSSMSATSPQLAAGAGSTWWAPAPASTTPWLSSVITLSQVGGTGPGGVGCRDREQAATGLFQRAMALSEVDEAVLGGPRGMGTGGWVAGDREPTSGSRSCRLRHLPRTCPTGQEQGPDLQALVGTGLGSRPQARVGLQGVSRVSPSPPSHPLDSAGDHRSHFCRVGVRVPWETDSTQGQMGPLVT